MLGEVVLVASNVPPVKALYQLIVLPLAPGVPVIVPVPHKDVFEAVGAEGMGFTVTTALPLMVELHPVELLTPTTV